ncbi:hypothetical protein RHGRI_024852 [Rhododendron griersonianum]|uniref:F-box associated beta-propeller type 1 domain-containing protein n=1 Tax=Rhododendron griersonianum TaxID=479676 RepID=A0AAV6JB12_9ERIC|nr:hypothetical protein RHGRI_024852 [Rhododendron griersonianum]
MVLLPLEEEEEEKKTTKTKEVKRELYQSASNQKKKEEETEDDDTSLALGSRSDEDNGDDDDDEVEEEDDIRSGLQRRHGDDGDNIKSGLRRRGGGFRKEIACGHPVAPPVAAEGDRADPQKVYDSNSGSWRVLHAGHFFPEVLIHDGPQISTYNKSDGVFHWFALHNYSRCSVSCYEGLVLSFDMSKELFHVTRLPEKFNTFTQKLTLPPNANYIKRKECSLGMIRDSLAVIFSFLEEGHTYIEVWVMKDFDCMVGVEKSSYRWFHELIVEVPIPGSWAPLSFWNKNELLIRKWKSELDTLILYDIVTKQARNVKISGERNFMYKESLVLVKGGCGN